MNEIFASWLSRNLRENNIKNVELAEQLNVSTKTVYNWKSGTHLPRRTGIEEIKEVIVSAYRPLEMIFPPINHWGDCRSCDYSSQCKKRVCLGLPAMCEGLTREDIDWAIHIDLLGVVVWWIESPNPDKLFT